MKNYIRNIIDYYVKYDYPKEINQNFRIWLSDIEHADEKDYELNKLWVITESATTPGYRHSLKRMHELTGIGTRRQLNSLHTHLKVWQLVATLLIAVSSISIYWALQNSQVPDLLQTYIPTAKTGSIILPDGTQVTINSQSTLIYPKQFTGNTRSVYLIGEANFKVKHDEKHPFIVKSNDFQVTALGTEFSVTAYPNEENTSTTLIGGKISVEYNNLKMQNILKPGEQLTYNKHTCLNKIQVVDVQDITAWQRGEIIFRGMSIAEIFTQLERKYPYTFIYSYHDLKQDKFNLAFKKQDSIEEIMDIISCVTGYLQYKIIDDKCYITKY